jgi:replication factor C large subunit
MTPSIAKRLKEICKEEGIDFDEDAIKNLARWSQGDMRSAIFDLQIISLGRDSFTSKDMDSLGFRERDSSIFNILPTIFHSKNISAARKMIWDSDKDSDEILQWIESSVHLVFRDPGSLARAYDILSRADMMRARVHIQQNWRFKGIMSDLMAGISLSGEPSGGYVPYQQPKKIMMMARSRFRRAARNGVSAKIGEHAHCSKRIVVRDYLPYMRIIMEKGLGEGDLELEEEDIKAIREN